MFRDDKTLSWHWEFKRLQSVVSLSKILRMFFAPAVTPYYIYVVRMGGTVDGRRGGFEGGKGTIGISTIIVPCVRTWNLEIPLLIAC